MTSTTISAGRGQPMSSALEQAPFYLGGEAWEGKPLNATSTVLSKSLTVKSGQGLLFGFSVFNSNASTQFVLVFDANTVPANGATAIGVFPVATISTVGVSFGTPGRWFRQGIILANSSTEPTLTLGSADCFFDAQYV